MGVVPVAAPTNPRQPMVALLVDRDADTRTMYAEYLRRSSYDIDEAADGREALAKALTGLPDVIVTETRLPGISGYDLCGLLRNDRATHSIPIVVVTADAFSADVQRAKRAGADAVLVKPCLPEALFAEVRRLTKQSRELRERAEAIRETIGGQIARSEDLLARSASSGRVFATLSRSHRRHETTTPPVTPPELICPACDRPLTYMRSHIGGVSARHPEQWDDFECPAGCGTFQYRARTRKLRRAN